MGLLIRKVISFPDLQKNILVHFLKKKFILGFPKTRTKPVTFDIKNQLTKVERHNLYLIKCPASDLLQVIQQINMEGLATLNMGKEMAELLKEGIQSKFLNLDAEEKLHHLLEQSGAEIKKDRPRVVAIYNLGILFEPVLKMNVSKILKELSKTISIIIIWENLVDFPGTLHWSEQKDKYYLDFEDVNLKQLNPTT